MTRRKGARRETSEALGRAAGESAGTASGPAPAFRKGGPACVRSSNSTRRPAAAFRKGSFSEGPDGDDIRLEGEGERLMPIVLALAPRSAPVGEPSALPGTRRAGHHHLSMRRMETARGSGHTRGRVGGAVHSCVVAWHPRRRCGARHGCGGRAGGGRSDHALGAEAVGRVAGAGRATGPAGGSVGVNRSTAVGARVGVEMRRTRWDY